MARPSGLFLRPLRIQLFHARYQAARKRSNRRHGRPQCVHRTNLACLAHLHPHHRWHTGPNGSIPVCLPSRDEKREDRELRTLLEEAPVLSRRPILAHSFVLTQLSLVDSAIFIMDQNCDRIPFMIGRICVRFGILALVGTVCFSRLGHAQSQGCADSTPPSLAPVQETKISIVDVEFQGENPLSDALRAKLATNIKQDHLWVTPEKSDSSWIDWANYPIRKALNNQGYFKASVEGTPYLVRALPAERLYVLSVVVESGPKFK